MRRWRARLQEHSYSGLRDGRKGKPSFRRVPLETCPRRLGGWAKHRLYFL
jgi:hypothetical protein